MDSAINVIAVIPARGGSKGVPRKNLRPLAGKPLIWYAIQACLAVRPQMRVVVSTDDDEIALFAERFGAEVLRRPAELSGDEVTLDPVIAYAVRQSERIHRERYDLVVTVQPTAPLVLPIDLERAIARISDTGVDTVLSVVDDRHLCWTLRDGMPEPAYAHRVNRQQLPPNFRETGAIIACSREQLDRGTRIGTHVALQEVPHERSFDIDTPVDFYLCESILMRKRIIFVVVGHAAVGLGHAFRSVTLAHDLVRHAVSFVCPQSSDLAIEHIRGHNYPVEVCSEERLLETVLALRPDMVVNDILDTEAEFVQGLKQSGAKVVNFEDLGEGGRHADLVVNALYPHQSPNAHTLVGAQYFCLREEFLHPPVSANGARVSVLVTFGGVDEGDLTTRVLRILMPLCAERQVPIDVVTGPGYAHQVALDGLARDFGYPLLTVVPATRRISDYMFRASMAVTSGGRTVLELAALRVPTVVICQNRRETTHTFASDENGVLNLGHREAVTDAEIGEALMRVLCDKDARATMAARMGKHDFTQGKRRVIESLEALLRIEHER